MTTPNKIPYILLVCLIILGMIASIIDALRIDEYTEKAKGIDFAGVYRLIASLGLVIYLFDRSSRNKVLYENKNPLLLSDLFTNSLLGFLPDSVFVM